MVRTHARGAEALICTVAVGLSLASPSMAAAADVSACDLPADGATPIATAKLYVEYNATDEDVGVHGMFDDAGWSELCILAPDGRPILVVDPQSQLDDLTAYTSERYGLSA